MTEPPVFAQGAMGAAVSEEVLELSLRRKLRRAQQPRDRQRAARIREPRTLGVRLPAQVTAQEAGKECIARTEHVVDLDIQARCDEAVLEGAGDLAREYHAAAGTAFADDDGGGE